VFTGSSIRDRLAGSSVVACSFDLSDSFLFFGVIASLS